MVSRYHKHELISSVNVRPTPLSRDAFLKWLPGREFCSGQNSKLELIETDLLLLPDSLPIQSMVAQVMGDPVEINSMPFNNLIGTQAEKVISLLRRTAALARNEARQDDETLTRHVYDCYFLGARNESRFDDMSAAFNKAVYLDIQRYGNQNINFKNDPASELRYGLEQVLASKLMIERYNKFVVPMTYGEALSWDDAIAPFTERANKLIDLLESDLADRDDLSGERHP